MRETEWQEKNNGELSWGDSGTSGTKLTKKEQKKKNKKFKKLQKKKRSQFMKDRPEWYVTDKEDFSYVDIIIHIEEKQGKWSYNADA